MIGSAIRTVRTENSNFMFKVRQPRCAYTATSRVKFLITASPEILVRFWWNFPEMVLISSTWCAFRFWLLNIINDVTTTILVVKTSNLDISIRWVRFWITTQQKLKCWFWWNFPKMVLYRSSCVCRDNWLINTINDVMAAIIMEKNLVI